MNGGQAIFLLLGQLTMIVEQCEIHRTTDHSLKQQDTKLV